MESITAQSITKESTKVDREELGKLKSQIRGEVITPENEKYDDARTIHNAMIDKSPALIAKCSDVADVISCVNFAREHDLLTAERCGGHNGAGLALAEDGLVIDLSRMKGIHVDPESQTVRVEGGCTWGEVDLFEWKYQKYTYRLISSAA